MSGQTATDSGLALTLPSRIARSSRKLAQAMENSLPQNASATNSIMETNASIWMNVPSIRTVELKESASILVEQLCQGGSATAIWDGLAKDVIKVSFF